VIEERGKERERGRSEEREEARGFLHEALSLFVAAGQPVELDLWDTGRRHQRGQSVLGYELRHGDTTIFSGEDFAGSPIHADDSDASLAALLSFLSLRPGDTDAEYFDAYNATQLEWADEYGDELSLVSLALSEAKIHSLDDLLRSEEFQESRFGSSSDDWISDPERRARVEAAAEFGADGSTHAEHIEDWRRSLRERFQELPDLVRQRIEAEIDEVESWHQRNGSLDDQVG